MNESTLQQASQWIVNAKYLTAFTGAGASVESGIPPFRGPDGLWSKYDPSVLELDRFLSHPEQCWPAIKTIFYDFFGQARPNPAHQVLASWEDQGLLKSVITQNIDNLHQQAGSRTVREFHGTSGRLSCTRCDFTTPALVERFESLPPRCDDCGAVLKPDFIFFGERIPERAATDSFNDARQCDVMLIIGTTGEVMPANQLPYAAKDAGAKVIEINPEASLYTSQVTDLHLQGKAGDVMARLGQAVDALKKAQMEG